MDPDGTQKGEFPLTQWTRWVQKAREGNPSALSELLSAYYSPLLNYLKWRWRLPDERAEDFLQGFLADKVLERNLVSFADRSKGRFRTYFLSALNHYVIDRFRAVQREGTQYGLESVAEPADSAVSSQQAFDLVWARQTISQALANMEAECRQRGRLDWEVFQARIVGPLLNGEPEIPYEALIERFGLKSPTEAFNLLVTGKRRFEKHLRAVLGAYVPTEEAIEEELADLRRILSSSDAGNAPGARILK
jgi:DNA-directed RNA polymerase specialized sigma24 family protein